MPQTIRVYRDLMGENDRWAGATRDLLQRRRLPMLNLIGAPGCGKTTLLENSLRALAPSLRVAVLEGDVETTWDAERLHALGIPVSQLLTNGACHLEAKLVNAALADLPLDDLDLVIVENVGNLVCPAEFDIGETMKLAVLSVTEGEDKPLKYPLLFREAKALVLTKIDLLPHLSYRVEAAVQAVHQIQPDLKIFQVSAATGAGLDAWLAWLRELAGRRA